MKKEFIVTYLPLFINPSPSSLITQHMEDHASMRAHEWSFHLKTIRENV